MPGSRALGHRRTVASTGLVVTRANPIAVGIVPAATAVIIGPCRSSADSSSADRRRTVGSAIPVAAVTVATPAHCDSATTSASNRNRAAAVTATGANGTPVKSATTTSEATTAATAAGIGIVWYQTGGEQNECCKSSKNIAKHDGTSLYEPCRDGELLRCQCRGLT